MPERKRPMGRAFVGEVGDRVPDCRHVLLTDLFDWPEAGGRYGTCADCFSTVRVREDERNDNRNVNEAA